MTSSRYACRLTHDEVALIRSKLQLILSVSEYFATPETQPVQEAVHKIADVLKLEPGKGFWTVQPRDQIERRTGK